MMRKNPKKKEMKLRYHVTIFFVDRRFGGNEEGEWWYDAGYPEKDLSSHSFFDLEKAREYLDKVLYPIADKINKDEGRREIGSSISNGCHIPMITDGLPRHFPLHRPRYE